MPDHSILQRENFDQLLTALKSRGYRVIGPTLRDGAIIYDDLSSAGDLPAGWTDVQNGGTYRLEKRADAALFGYVVGPHSWKQFLHPPAVRLWQADRAGKNIQIQPEAPVLSKMAFIGVRACEIHAITIQDKVFLGGPFVDSHYKGLRESALIVAVNCGQAGNTCFCASMNAGPKVTAGFDVALTEVIEGSEHYFVAEAGTPRGAEILAEVKRRPAEADEVDKANQIHRKTAQQMGRSVDTVNIKELLYGNMEHPRWDNVASRCLACSNCTMVCPTCFCTTVEDVTDLTGDHAERWQKWDSCFTADFSYVHRGSVRNSTRSRYRQWMTHKLASWFDQFGSSGCVGCGRCITWCPVGIDITEEVRAIRAADLRTSASVKEPDHGNVGRNPS